MTEGNTAHLIGEIMELKKKLTFLKDSVKECVTLLLTEHTRNDELERRIDALEALIKNDSGASSSPSSEATP